MTSSGTASSNHDAIVAPHAPALLTGQEVIELQDQAAHVRVDESIIDYILAIVERTRTHESLTLGVSVFLPPKL